MDIGLSFKKLVILDHSDGFITEDWLGWSQKGVKQLIHHSVHPVIHSSTALTLQPHVYHVCYAGWKQIKSSKS